jgi:hypothetical protein
VSRARAPSCRIFFCGTLSLAPSPSSPSQDRRRPPEPSPHRRTPPPIRFFSPPRRHGALVSYRLHPHARRVASRLWVLEHRRLLHLHRCSATAGRATKRARSAVTASACARAPHRRGPRALCTGPSQHCGRGPCALHSQAEPTLWAWATRHCATGPSAVLA